MRYFTIDEFDCKCCHGNTLTHMNKHFLNMLDHARDIAGVPFKITSGYRCARHNARVGGVPGSAHTVGCAADIATADSTTRYRVLHGLIKAGFRRIGIAKDFIHADEDPAKTNQVMWVYDYQRAT